MSAAQVNEQRRKEIQERCTKEAWKVGGNSALTALGISGAVIGAANYFSHGFRTSLGVSGKAALIVSAAAACMHLCVLDLFVHNQTDPLENSTSYT